MHEFLADLDLVFYNCRIYNGTESIVGKIGLGVQAESENMVRNFNLKERFGNPDEYKKFALDLEDTSATIQTTPVHEFQEKPQEQEETQQEETQQEEIQHDHGKEYYTTRQEADQEDQKEIAHGKEQPQDIRDQAQELAENPSTVFEEEHPEEKSKDADLQENVTSELPIEE